MALCQICPGKIIAFVDQFQAECLGTCVCEAITKVQIGFVTNGLAGVVTLTRRAWRMVGAEASDARGGLPCVESFQSVIAGGVCRAAAGRDREAISDGGLACNEPLQPAWRAKSLHAALSLSKRQMAVLRAIVHPLCERCSSPGATSRLAAP